MSRRNTNTPIKLVAVRISGLLCTSPFPSSSALDRLLHASPCIIFSFLFTTSYFMFKVDGKLCTQNGVVITLTLIMGIICCLLCLHEKFNRGFLPPSTFFAISVFYLITSLLTNPSNVCFSHWFPSTLITIFHHRTHSHFHSNSNSNISIHSLLGLQPLQEQQQYLGNHSERHLPHHKRILDGLSYSPRVRR